MYKCFGLACSVSSIHVDCGYPLIAWRRNSTRSFCDGSTVSARTFIGRLSHHIICRIYHGCTGNLGSLKYTNAQISVLMRTGLLGRQQWGGSGQSCKFWGLVSCLLLVPLWLPVPVCLFVHPIHAHWCKAAVVIFQKQLVNFLKPHSHFVGLKGVGTCSGKLGTPSIWSAQLECQKVRHR